MAVKHECQEIETKNKNITNDVSGVTVRSYIEKQGEK
jgi:hypothetical protein